jgi:putative transcriptional regulator
MATGQQPLASEGFLHGKLLIAMPGMSDPRFGKSVIFMCQHSEAGAMGLIVNKPLDLNFKNLMDKMDIPTVPLAAERRVMFGGPVDTDKGYILHSTDRTNHPPSTIVVTPEIAMTLTVDMLKRVANGNGPSRWMMALGYAGWGPGQVESEIASNGWIHCEPDNEIIFDTAMEAKWSRAFDKLGANLSGLSWQSGRA